MLSELLLFKVRFGLNIELQALYLQSTYGSTFQQPFFCTSEDIVIEYVSSCRIQRIALASNLALPNPKL
jgi:hypothetical protein